MSYSLHKALLGISEDFKYAFDNGDLGMARRTIDGDLATAYAFAKELELHGYEAFCDLAKEYGESE